MAINLEKPSVSHTIPMNSDKMTPINMKNDLNRKFSELRNRAGTLETRKILDKDKLSKLRINIINQIFGVMKEIGVDPSNLESVSKFLQQLEAADPDMLILFESAMKGLTETQETPSQLTTPEVVPEQTNVPVNNL